MIFVKLFLLAFVTVLNVEAYSSGAPSAACEDMIPQHHVEPIKTENPPFEIVYTHINNSTLDVTIQSKEEGKRFRGFLIQARREWTGEAIGKWSTEEQSTQSVECFDRQDSAVTHAHKNSVSKKNGFAKVTFRWTAPEDLHSINGTILIATVAETSKIIFLNVSTVVRCNETVQEIARDEATIEHHEEPKEEEKRPMEEEKRPMEEENKPMEEENKPMEEETKPIVEEEVEPLKEEEEFKQPEEISDKDQEIKRLQQEVLFLRHKLKKFLAQE